MLTAGLRDRRLVAADESISVRGCRACTVRGIASPVARMDCGRRARVEGQGLKSRVCAAHAKMVGFVHKIDNSKVNLDVDFRCV